MTDQISLPIFLDVHLMPGIASLLKAKVFLPHVVQHGHKFRIAIDAVFLKDGPRAYVNTFTSKEDAEAWLAWATMTVGA